MEDDNTNDQQDDGFLSYDPEIWDIATPGSIQTWWRIDPSKIKTIEDVALLLDAINIKFINTHTDFDKISHLLKEEKR